MNYLVETSAILQDRGYRLGDLGEGDYVVQSVGGVISLDWRHPTDPKPTPEDVEGWRLEYVRSRKLGDLERERNRRASEVYSFIGQSNAESVFQLILDLRALVPSPNTIAGIPRLAQLKAIRDAWAAARDQINALTTFAEVEAYDVATDPAWP